jgi:hypothetical protein
MKIEFIKLSHLINACVNSVEATKEERYIAFSDALNKLNPMDYTQDELMIIHQYNTFTPNAVYVQKANDKMRVMDGVYYINQVVFVLNKLKIKDDITMICNVDYVEEFNFEKLKQIKKK